MARASSVVNARAMALDTITPNRNTSQLADSCSASVAGFCSAIDRRQNPAGQRVERFNGRIEEVLQSHHFHSGEELETTLHRYALLYNQQLPQSALGSKTPLQAMKDWHKLKPELFRKQPYHLPGCDR